MKTIPINPIPKTATAGDVKEVGRIVYDKFTNGLRFIIMRSKLHFCGYVGIPNGHPLVGFDYNDFSFVEAHGGLTFSGEGEGWPEGYYWYGWDYGHVGDKIYVDYSWDGFKKWQDGNKEWTVNDIIEDSQNTLETFESLMKLAEKIKM